eukprot:6489619-Amphidinium_carterae.2
MWKLLLANESTSPYRTAAALVAQGHRILRARSPWAAAMGPASAILLMALRLGFEVTLYGKLKMQGKLLDVANLGQREVKDMARSLTDKWTLRECRAFSASLRPFECSIIVNAWAGANWTMEIFESSTPKD